MLWPTIRPSAISSRSSSDKNRAEIGTGGQVIAS
jgi:hypothetical protein